VSRDWLNRVPRLLEESSQATGREFPGYWKRVPRLLEELSINFPMKSSCLGR